MEKDKTRFSHSVAYTVALLICLFNLVTRIYQAFKNTHIISANDYFELVVKTVDDFTVIMLVVCIAYIVVALLNKFEDQHKGPLVAFFLIDIFLIVRLYSNGTWLSIAIFFKRHLRFIFFIVLLMALALVITVPVIIFAKRQRKSNDLSNLGKGGEPSTNEKEDVEDKNSSGTSGRSKTEILFSMIGAVILALIAAFVAWIFLDYLLTEKIKLDIQTPEFIIKIEEYKYYAVVVAPAVLLALFIIARAAKKSVDGHQWTFGNIAIGAMILEVGILCVLGQVNFDKINNDFLNEMQNSSVFSVIVSLIVIFFVLFILITVVSNFFGKGRNKELYDTIQENVQEIQEYIVKIAFGLVTGCLRLLDFIPDFFDTIGVLLLGQEPRRAKKE